jgi:DNA-binding response OmpR family regulator
VSYKQEIVVLTAKEFRLLELFLRNPEFIFSRNHIIDRIWSVHDCPSQAAVTNLVKDLRRKLREAGMEEEIIETIRSMGYRLMTAPPEFAEMPISVVSDRLPQPVSHRAERQMVSASVG